MLARALPDNSLRFLRKRDDNTREILVGGGETNQLIADSLGILPDNGVKLFIGVEGKHDLSFLKGIAKVMMACGIVVPDLERLELDGKVIFFPFGGENLALWTSRLEHLNRPEFHICDRDNQPPAEPKYKAHMDGVNQRPGCTAVCTGKREMENYIHPRAIEEAYAANGTVITLPAHFGNFEDVPETVARAVHTASGEITPWEELDQDLQRKKSAKAKAQINGPAVLKMTRDMLQESDFNEEVTGWLRRMGEMMEL